MDGYIFISIGVVTLSIIVTLLFSKITLYFILRIDHLNKFKLTIQIKLVYGAIRINKSLDLKERLAQFFRDEHKSVEAINKWHKKFEDTANDIKIKDLKKPVFESLKKMDIHCLIWHSGAGTGDASVTGRLAGVAWSIKGVIEAWLKQNIRMKKDPEISFTPFFQSAGFESDLSCMVSIRIGKAILTILGLYNTWKKLKNRRIESDGTSNQRVNDDSDGKLKRNDRCKYDRRRSG